MVNGELVKCKHLEKIADHYRYRVAVDNNNVLKHDGGINYQIGFYNEQGTTWWTIGVFDFFHSVY